MSQNHQPDPEFVSNLEWQVRTALRREERFGHPTQSRSLGGMKMATLLLLAALMGAGGVVVKDEIQEARQQEILLAEVLGSQRLTEMEIGLLAEQLQEVSQEYGAGMAHQDALLGARFALTDAEMRLEELRLDEEEIRATGRRPDNSLSAPLVNGRDLVTERLELDRRRAREEENLARAQIARILDLRESEMVADAQLLQGSLRIQETESRVSGLDFLLDLRNQVLDGRMTGREAQRRAELGRLRGEMDVLEQTRNIAAMQVQQIQDQASQGLLEESQVRGAHLHLMEIETRLEILRMKLAVLEEEAGGSSGR